MDAATTDNKSQTKSFAALEFFNEFRDFKNQMEEDLDRLRCSVSKNPTEELQAELKRLTVSLLDYEKKLCASLVFLAPYDARQSQMQIKELSEALEGAKLTLKPKTKFSFKRKVKAPDASASRSSQESLEKQSSEQKLAAERVVDLNVISLENLSGECKVLVVNDHKDVMLSALCDCSIVIRCKATSGASVGSLHACNLKKCYIAIEVPVDGSAMLDNCHQSTAILACRQFRMHNSIDCTVSLLCMSLPIIEDSSELQFAPFAYLLIPPDAKDAVRGLRDRFTQTESPLSVSLAELNTFSKAYYNDSESADAQTSPLQNFKMVKDFNWIKPVHSPNWSAMTFRDYVNFYSQFCKFNLQLSLV